MTCRESALEVMECVRGARTPGVELQAHLMACPRCNERYEDERRLSAHFRIMRGVVVHQPSMARRERLMREFEHAHEVGFRGFWPWALNAAAILLVVLAMVYCWRNRAHSGGKVAPQQAESAADISGEESDFVSIPYALPLAKGEFVRVVRTQLDPAALADMGLDLDAAGGAEIPADVLLGEDGVPRGVRVLPETGYLSLE